MTKTSLQQTITDQIIAQMAAGTPPWQQPWTGGATGAALPLRHNGEPYRGINVLVLWAAAMRMGYASERWMTFKQAQALGGQVRKGERASTVVKFGTFEKEDEAGEDKAVSYLIGYAVFNADQIKGLPAEYYREPAEPARDLGTRPNAELNAFFDATSARIETTTEARAYYRPISDHIHMPPVETFHSVAGYYATLAHELIHWTGAKHRLDRLARCSDRKGYAFEELVAEIGNCFLCARLGLKPDFEQSAAYVAGWLSAMKSDNRAIFRAASEAQKAVDFVLALCEPAQQVAAE